MVEDWEDMGLVWDHCFRDVLGVDPSEGGCYIMLTGARVIRHLPRCPWLLRPAGGLKEKELS